ncbi:hypothetical protein FM042_02335 [Aliidiomarina halalkaliphila]|uniref:Lipoprotein n=1 Tax=Aliidiomarina halalkaliphila TaxID=2593535 RepID=A0A552X3Z8_9GAMM|nr:DUF6279 family lipoprotein [Aliidiomarina halalkaliphila]TRW49715.1 hypothetical protein FM042_02335 [Aliidiomarina halalkaliphila]
MRWIMAMVCIALILGSLSACSSRQLGYRYAEQLVSWQAGRIVSLTSEQRQQLRSETDALLQWHAETQLPEYMLALNRLYRDANSKTINTEDLEYYEERLYRFWLDLRKALVAPSVRLLSKLSDNQVEELLSYMQERQEKRIEERSERDAEERIAQHEERLLKQIRDNMGRPTAQQQALIQAWATEVPETSQLWFEYNQRWSNAFAEALTYRHDEEAFAQRIERLWVQPEQFRSDDMVAVLMEHRAVTMELMVKIHGSMTDRQRQRLMRTIDGFRRDVIGMMRQRDAVPQSR